MQFETYLHFDGDCEEAFKFYQQCFDGKIEAMLPHAGSPVEYSVPAEWRNKIMHARLVIGDAALMGCDAPPSHFETPRGFSVAMNVSDPAKAERIFQAFEKDGKIRMPLQKTFWATRFGTVTDRFGTPWMINCIKAAEQAA